MEPLPATGRDAFQPGLESLPRRKDRRRHLPAMRRHAGIVRSSHDASHPGNLGTALP